MCEAGSDDAEYENYQNCEEFLTINFNGRIGLPKVYVASDSLIDLRCSYVFPSLNADMGASLINVNGRLYDHDSIFAKKYATDKIYLRKVRCELEAQIKKSDELVNTHSHIDNINPSTCYSQYCALPSALPRNTAFEQFVYP